MTHQPALTAFDTASIIGTTSVSEPLTIDQDHLSSFAFSTYLDENYVDLTVSRNNALGPELVDGFLLLSLLTYFSFSKPFLDVEGAYAFNYGLDRVRFTAPVFVGEQVYAERTVTDIDVKSSTRARVTEHVELKKPDGTLVLVAEWISLFIDGAAEREAA